MAACSAVHERHGSQTAPRLTVTRTFESSAPIACHHCEDAPCARVCPVEAIRIEAGSVRLDEKRCIGCKMCALACPFGAITPSGTAISGVGGLKVPMPTHSAALDPILAWDLGVRSVAVKCDLCDFLPEGPACIRACPTDALHLVGGDDLDRSADLRRQLAAVAVGPSLPLVSTGEHENP
ncbi:4Fe-4S dicluster domain-containing protein [Siculibacillus lacustris]|nr:4Fe-4S dicluster domain-containing protein [Siculibacillus lacustris]